MWAETGYYVGLGITNLIQLYNPEVLIVGGGIAHAGKALWDPMLRTVPRGRIWSRPARCASSRPSSGKMPESSAAPLWPPENWRRRGLNARERRGRGGRPGVLGRIPG